MDSTPLSPADQFPAALRAEHEAHGYRYINITAATRRCDVTDADKQNAKMYRTLLQSHRHQDKYGARASVSPETHGVVPPPEPTNRDRYDMYLQGMRRVEAMPLAIAVHNLALHGKVLFRDYTPENAISTWARLERQRQGWERARAHSFPSPSPVRRAGSAGPGANSSPTMDMAYAARAHTPPPPSYARWSSSGDVTLVAPASSPALARAAAPPFGATAPDGYLAAHAPAGHK